MSNINCNLKNVTNLSNKNRLAYYKFCLDFYDKEIITTMVKDLFFSQQKSLKITINCESIKIQKNKIYNFVLNRQFDSYSNINISYNNIIKKVNILDLPEDVNDIINDYLKLDVRFNISSNGSIIFDSCKNKNKNKIIHKLNLKMNKEFKENKLFNYANNTLPSVAIPFNELNLEVESNYDVKIKIRFDCIIYEAELRRNISTSKYEYNNKFETVIMNGLIGKRKIF